MSLSLAYSWGFEPIKYQRGVHLRCAVWRPNTAVALCLEMEGGQTDTKRENEGNQGMISEKHNRAVRSTKKAVFILHLKT